MIRHVLVFIAALCLTIAIITIVVALVGCSSLRLSRPQHVVEPNHLAAVAPPSPFCISLSNKAMTWNIIGIVSGGVGSGAATGAGIFTDPPALKYVLGGTGGVFSLLGAVASYVGGVYAARYTKACE